MILLDLFFSFFKVGLFCFGGGFGMLPLIEETVVAKGWLSQDAFYNFVGVCESTPGPIAVNVATYVGATQAGFPGSLAATAGTVMPSFLIILLIAAALKNLTGNRYFKGFITGVKPVVAALIVSTGVKLLVQAVGFVSLTEFHFDWVSLVIFALIAAISFAASKLWKKKLSSIQIILISAVLGIGLCMLTQGV